LVLSLRSVIAARRSISYTTGFLIRSSSVDAPHWFDGQELEKHARAPDHQTITPIP
jgi:hypothetical protein